ncbi:hypothetical protein AB0D38_37315 [Streptomyces sp. NPDC048279]|uniref:hypothetical protein n=1 Tax=Streptomyces sp. NPDC048279 TaxID=3154714 RepID=UPI0034169C65
MISGEPSPKSVSVPVAVKICAGGVRKPGGVRVVDRVGAVTGLGGAGARRLGPGIRTEALPWTAVAPGGLEETGRRLSRHPRVRFASTSS